MCKRKLLLSDIACGKCKGRFCAKHRQPELHECPLETFIREGKELLSKQNPKIVADKMIRI
jgi:predicted nucleic acid binding AN1-type Zn finger protein